MYTLFHSDCIICSIDYEDMVIRPAYPGYMGSILYITTSCVILLSYLELHNSAIAMYIGENSAAINLLHSFEGHQVLHVHRYGRIRLNQLRPIILRQFFVS